MNIINKIKKNILSPKKYAKSIGVNFGEGCEFYKNISWGSEPYLIEIGSNVRITNGVKFTTHDGGIWVLRNLKIAEDGDIFGKIKIGDNCHIGFDVIFMPGVEIGDNCIIGCGAVVTKSIPSNSIAVGVPAKVIKSIDDYYKTNKSEIVYTKKLTSKEKKNYIIKNIL